MAPRLNILFVHQNFPGQFLHLAPALRAAGHDVRALSIGGRDMEGIGQLRYKPRRNSAQSIHPFAADFETKLIRAEACAVAAAGLKKEGWRPDVIVGHPGWGEMLFLKDVWPDVRQLHFLEFYYAVQGGDSGFDPEFQPSDWLARGRVRAKNANGLLNLEMMDAAYSPTEWQKSSYPGFAQDRIRVIHDGINTDLLTPDASVGIRLGHDQPILRRGMEVVTFVNRNLEPYRGYHIFMRALPRMQALRPNALFVLVGADGVSYGAAPPNGGSWKQIFLDEVAGRIDPARVFFVGHVPYEQFVALMRISAAHVYLTYPFVLSWSMLEAMSCGALIIGSDTPPVTEVIEQGRNGVLIDFFDTDGLADRVADALGHPARYQDLRLAARQTIINRYDLKRICLPRQMDLVTSVAMGRSAAP